LVGAATAAITPLDSSSFSKKFEMNAVGPNELDPTGTTNEWSAIQNSGATASLNSGFLDYDTTALKTADLFWDSVTDTSVYSSSTGSTVEFKLRVDATAAGQADDKAFQVLFGDSEGYAVLFVHLNAVSFISQGNIQSGVSNSDTYHTFRIAQDANSNLFQVWKDGTQIGTDLPGVSAAHALWFGDGSGDFGGKGSVDYFRFTAGAYSPLNTAFSWNVDSSGDWNRASNWTTGIPNGVDGTANLLDAISAPRTIYTDTAITLGSLTFDNAASYQITGQGSLIMDVSTGSATIDVVQGSHKINLPLFINDNTVANVAAGATLKISDPTTLVGGAMLTKTGPGTLSIEAPMLNAAPATLASAAGVTNALMDLGINTLLNVSGGTVNLTKTQHLAAFDVSGGTTNVGPGSNVVVSTKSLSISGTGKIDLQNGKLVVDYDAGSALATVKAAIDSGSLTSSQLSAGRAIGYGEASDLSGIFPLSFGGELVDSTSILVAYTVVADASLDGVVSSNDFNLLAANYGKLTAARWTQGDFNNDGKVTTLDFNLLAGNFGQSLPPGASLGAVVPEPASAGLIIAGMALVMRKRRNGSD